MAGHKQTHQNLQTGGSKVHMSSVWSQLIFKECSKEHSDRHSEAKEVRCKYCGEKFYNKSKRSIHYLKCSAKKEYEEQLRLEREGADKETK